MGAGTSQIDLCTLLAWISTCCCRLNVDGRRCSTFLDFRLFKVWRSISFAESHGHKLTAQDGSLESSLTTMKQETMAVTTAREHTQGMGAYPMPSHRHRKHVNDHIQRLQHHSHKTEALSSRPQTKTTKKTQMSMSCHTHHHPATNHRNSNQPQVRHTDSHSKEHIYRHHLTIRLISCMS